MEDNKYLKVLYALFLGVFLAVFIGAGVNTFYPSPKAPEYPVEMNTYSKEPSRQDLERQREYDRKSKEYAESVKPYNRNVSIITLSASVILVVLSIVFEKRMKIIADGVMLGGLFTLLYSLGRGFASEDSKYVFVAVTVGLAVVLYLGYHRFVRAGKSSTPAKKKK